MSNYYVLGKLDVAKKIADPFYKSLALIDLAPHLKGNFIEALLITNSIQKDPDKAKVLIAFAGYLDEPAMGMALEITRTIQDSFYKSEVLIAFTPYLNHWIPQALKIAKTIEDSCYQNFALQSLATLPVIG